MKGRRGEEEKGRKGEREKGGDKVTKRLLVNFALCILLFAL